MLRNMSKNAISVGSKRMQLILKNIYKYGKTAGSFSVSLLKYHLNIMVLPGQLFVLSGSMV